MIIRLPVLELRDYQAEAWDYLMEHDTKKSFMLWHRRAGKDLFALQYVVAKAIERVGNYWYLLPQQNQVRRAIWEGITSKGVKYLDMIPPEIVYKRNNSEMKLILRNPSKPDEAGSIISFLGGDNYDALAGSGIAGAVVSELALQKPNLYDLILEPMLKETNGWVMFNTTPRGENHAKDMWDFLTNNPKYFTSKKTIEDTGVVNPEDLEEERERGKPEEIIQQEYYVSFAGAIYGAYYADVLQKFHENQGLVPYNQNYLVHTMWDLGVSDSTAIWFVQFIDGTVRCIDYYENHTYGLGHYAQVVLNKPYSYAGHHLPHDGTHRQLTATERAMSIQAQLMQLGLKNIDIIPRTSDVYADIQNVRAILSRTHFDVTHCKDGLQALKQYRREYDENRKCFKDTPYHDWTSHACLAPETKILMENGEKRIDEVSVGDIVITPMGKRKVLSSGLTGVKRVIELDINGATLVCTPDHKIFTKQGLVNADSLGDNSGVFRPSFGDKIIWNTIRLFGLMEKDIGYREIITRVTIGEVEQRFTGLYGKNILVNLYLTAITFTILMEIPLIMIFQILSALVKKNIYQCTQNKTSGLKKIDLNFCKHKSLPRLGTLAKRVIDGIANTVKRAEQIVSGIKQSVQFVAKNIQRPTLLALHIVVCDARKSTCIIRKKERLLPVYNLTIERDHCFYANGILVSNCDAFRAIPIVEQKIKGADIKKRSREWNGRF